MSYSSEMANLIAKQLARFVTLNRHQLAGQVANLDFWLDQVRHGLNVIDGYEQRFNQMRTAQHRYVEEHRTVQFTPGAEFPDATPADQPRRVSDVKMKDARRAMTVAAYRFLVRCCNEQFITEQKLRQLCEGLGIGVESSDLKMNKGQ